MREIVALFVSLVGLPALVRNTLGRKGVGILLYHDPDPMVFEAHLRYLRQHYNIVPYADVVRAIETSRWAELPEQSIVVHIDDGYKRNYELMPICVRHNVRPTIYVCSHVVGTHRRFWSRLMQGRSKHLRLVDNRRLLAKLSSEAAFSPQREYPAAEALSTSQITDMAPQFDFQSHGRYHFSLITMDAATLEDDIESSRSRVEEITGRPCEHFSLPYGDFTSREIDALKQAGFKTVRTTLPGWVTSRTDPYRIPILADVPGDVSTRVLAMHLTGIPRALKRLVYELFTRHVYALRERSLMSRVFFTTE